MAPGAKALNECKGYAVADYQDHLEKTWIETLKKEYPLKLEEDVLKMMIK
jgi:peptidyl-prolyl cis-trans isomerase SurA